MAAFKDANQARIQLKMKLSVYSWYGHSAIATSEGDGYSVVIYVKKLDNKVKKLIPPVINDVGIKIELE